MSLSEADQKYLDLIYGGQAARLAAYYPLDGDGKDHSGNDRHAAFHGAEPAMGRRGHDKGAYSFDGQDDYLKIEDDPGLEFGKGNYAISLCISTDYQPPNPGCALMNKHETDLEEPSEWDLYIYDVSADYHARHPDDLDLSGDDKVIRRTCTEPWTKSASTCGPSRKRR